jgi:hypothetical protein
MELGHGANSHSRRAVPGGFHFASRMRVFFDPPGRPRDAGADLCVEIIRLQIDTASEPRRVDGMGLCPKFQNPHTPLSALQI